MLTLDLALDKDTCKGERTSDRFAAEPLACESASPRAHLTCTTTTFEVGDPPLTGHPHPAAKLEAWMCAPEGTASLGESQVSRVFGKQACIKAWSGHMSSSGPSYERCSP